MLLSTAQVNSPWSNNGLTEYLTILPELCAEIGAAYWDMSSWFGGPWSRNNEEGLMADDVHVSAKGGEKIAGQLYEEILKLAHAARGEPAAKPAGTKGRTTGERFAESAVPNQIAGLSGWWSAQGEMVVDESGGVIRWMDALGRNANAIAPWSFSRPQVVNEATSTKPLLRFDGKGSHLLFPMQDGARTLFVVLRADRLILGHPYFNTRPFSVGAVRPDKAFSANYASKNVTGGQGFLNGQAVHLGDDEETALQFDPAQLQVFSLIMAGPEPFSYLGWGGSWNFNRYLKGEVAEILVYNRAVTDEERRRIETDLAGRWAIQR